MSVQESCKPSVSTQPHTHIHATRDGKNSLCKTLVCPARSSHATCSPDPSTKSRHTLFGSSCTSISGAYGALNSERWYLFTPAPAPARDPAVAAALSTTNPCSSRHMHLRFHSRLSGNCTLTSPMKAATRGGPTASEETSSWSVGEMPVGVLLERPALSDDDSRRMKRPVRLPERFSDLASSPEPLVSVKAEGDMAGMGAASRLTEERRLLMERRRVRDED